MAEVTPAVSTTNHFSLSAEFETSASGASPANTEYERLTGIGDLFAFGHYDEIINYTQAASYVNATPAIIVDLGTMASAFGTVANSKLPTSIELKFEAGEPADVSIEGHQHSTNPHTTASNVFDWSGTGVVPAGAGLGVPTIITVEGDASPISATVRVGYAHTDHPGADGTHFSSASITCVVELSIEYEGEVTGNADPGDWLNVLITNDETNTDTPKSSLTAKQYIDATV